MADINQKENTSEHLGLVQIILDHLSPFDLHLHIGPCITIARQIYIIERIIDMVEINRLCFTRLCRDTCIGLTVHQRIDQRRFPYI